MNDTVREIRRSFGNLKNRMLFPKGNNSEVGSFHLPSLKQWIETMQIRSEVNKARTSNHYAVPGVGQSGQQTTSAPLSRKPILDFSLLSANSFENRQNTSKATDIFVSSSAVQSSKEQIDVKVGNPNAATTTPTILASALFTSNENQTVLTKSDKSLIVQPASTLDAKDNSEPVNIENGTISATAEQIQETAEIRKEISEAVAHNEFAVPSATKQNTDATTTTTTVTPALFTFAPIKTLKGASATSIIVQPDTTVDAQDSVRPVHMQNGKILATAEKIQETAEIRKEISEAVAHNEFAVPSVTVQPTEYPGFLQVLNQVVGDDKKIPAENNTSDEMVGDIRSDFSFVTENVKPSVSPIVQPSLAPIVSPPNQLDLKIEELTKKLIEDSKKQLDPKVIPNFVDSQRESSNNVPPIAPNRPSKNLREVFTINSVRENPNFQIGDRVFAWKTLQRNTKNKHALIGLTSNGVVLVYEENSEYKIKKEIPLFSAPTCLTTFTRWNDVNGTIEGVAVLGTQKELVFLKINEAMNDMDIFWIWQISKPLTAIEYLHIDRMNMLVLISSIANRNSADLYRFNLKTKDFWLLQGITLKTAADNLAYLHTGYDHLLSFPQNNAAVVYRFSKGRFIYFTELPMENSKTISAFQMGGYAYLALGGDKPVIMRYQNGNFHAQTILAEGWGTVEYFLPVSARTYRDDLIVLVQHRIDFDSHRISVVEALIWNGEAFDAALAIPCHINNSTLSHGLECMIDLERDSGIQGATVIQHSKYITILVPRHKAPSGLFDFHVELKPVTFEPLNNDASLYAGIAEVVEYLKMQDTLIRNGVEALEAIDGNEPLSLKTIDKVNSKSLVIDENVKIETIILGEEVLTKDIMEKVIGFETILNETLKTSEKPEENVRQVRQTESLHIETLRVKNLNVEYFNDVPAENLVYIENGSLRLKGPFIIEKDLEVNQLQILPDELLGSEETINRVSDLRITGNIGFDVINGVPWNKLVQEIVLTNLPNYLEDIEISGVREIFDIFCYNCFLILHF